MVLSSRSQTIVRGRSTALDVSRSFLKWGGFYNLPKMEPRLIEDLELFSDNTAATDHIRMRRVLQKHSAVLGVRNPCEITRRENVTATAPIKWESIPGLEDASVAAEDPSETIQTEVSASRHTRLRGRLSDADTIQKEVSTVQQAIQHKAQQDIDSAFRLSQRSATTPRPTPIETPKGSVLPEINEIPIDRDANVVSKKQPVARDSKVNRTNAQEKQATITQSVVQVAVGRGSAERNSQAKLAELKQRAVELEAANARLKAAEIEAAARLKAAKIAADKAKLDAQLKAAERAANRLAGKRGVTQSTKVEEEMVALKEVDFRPSFKMRPEVKAKMEEQLEGEMEEETEKEREEKSTESLASRITSFFKLGSR
ncbi:hypothetical protein BDQ17DRAFT_1344061 [Cyathus striatus]|nr:hypothetical protein BDQ17DRAFT_1344061 [Cyathus striatus]